jgi:hypothetical protein
MNRKHRIALALLRLYPKRWRREYGAELLDVMLARPITMRTLADLAWNGLRQRGRDAAPSTILGLASMLAVSSGIVLAGGSYTQDWTAVVRPSSMTFPTITVTFLNSNLYGFLLVVCGAWTYARSRGSARQSGMAAMRMSLVAGAPVILGAALLALGAIDIHFVDPLRAMSPNPWAMMMAPLARLPESWLLGAFGGQVARRALPHLRSPAAP